MFPADTIADRQRDRKRLRMLTILVWAVLVMDAVIIFWGSRRGLDLTDEGYYWLNYAYSPQYPVWSGFIVMGAKLAAWFHLDVVSLRWFRFLLLLLTHLIFAAAVIRWLQRQLRLSNEQPWVGRFGFALLTACVTMPYVWAPPSLWYNDWAGIFGLLAVAFGLLMFSPGGGNTPLKVFGWATGVGFMLGWLAFVKWTSALGVGALLGVAVCCGWGRQWRLMAGFALGVFIGVVLALGCIQLTCIDLGRFFHDVHDYSILLAVQSHRPATLLLGNLHDFWHTHLRLLRDFGWAALLLVAWPEVFYRMRRSELTKVKCLWLAGTLWGLTALAAAADYFRGADKTSQSMPVHFALACLMAAAWLGCRWRGERLRQTEELSREISQSGKSLSVHADENATLTKWLKPGGLLAGLVLLAGLPWAVAFGSSNSPLYPGAHLMVAWKALFLAALTAAWSYRALRKWCLGLALLSIALSQGQFIDGYILRPYRLAGPLTRQSHPVPNLPRGSDLLFDAKTAAFLGELAERCRAAGMEADRPVIALYDMPGLVYLLGGKSPVTPWYFDPRDVPQLAARALAQFGRTENHEGAKPLLLVNEELDPETLGALVGAGIDYPAGYTNVGSFTDPSNKKEVRLWVPK